MIEENEEIRSGLNDFKTLFVLPLDRVRCELVIALPKEALAPPCPRALEPPVCQ